MVEGIKGVQEFLKSAFVLHSLYTTDPSMYDASSDIVEINDETLKK